ncbi:MAG: phytoene/squalene synthase family protein [Anaerolineales bacterium]|nr:phytoene/squalene synthase family protein [Anaerolineales bacterium]
MASLQEEALMVLEATSRTFFIPISRLPARLLDAVGSGYLCMRAIDEIEDHPGLENGSKASLLRGVSRVLQSTSGALENGLDMVWGVQRDLLPEVTLRLGDWIRLAPASIAPRIWDATAAMADRMAHWSETNWSVCTEADLDSYTFSVAGAVGLMLSDLWAWYDGTQTDRNHAIGFGRGLQAVNILRNREDDLARGVDFFPDGWGAAQMQAYARRNLTLADAYIRELGSTVAVSFCKIPLALAYATLDILAQGGAKLSRRDVLRLIEQATGV